LTLPTAYVPDYFRGGAGDAAVEYMIANVGRILCPPQWEPGWHTPEFGDGLAATCDLWASHGYPRWLMGIRGRWDHTSGSLVEMPDDSMIAWGSKAEQDADILEAEGRGGDYGFPGQVFDGETRRYVWPIEGREKILHRAAYFERLQSARASEGLVPVPRGIGGVALDPRTSWALAADQVSALLSRTGAGWLVHSGNKTPHFHAGGDPGQGFRLRVPWSLDEFRDAVADFYRALQRHHPGLRILKIELPELDGKSAWLEARGVSGVWNHGPHTGLAVPLGLGPPRT